MGTAEPTGAGGRATVAIVQHPPAVLDLQRSLDLAVRYVDEAASAGAGLVVFSEAWLTGYPAWVFGLAGWDDPVARGWHSRLAEQSPVLGTPDDLSDGLGPVRRAARERQVTVVIGLTERAGLASGTLYNSLATIAPDGHLANLHRKLTPTHTERITWSAGDGAGLRVVDSPVGRLGGLICWEHWLPLARQALHAQDEQIHVAAWPDTPPMHHVASRGYAFEGRCFVVCAGQYVTTDDVPESLRDAYRAGLGPDAPASGLLLDGGSGVIGPDGEWLVGPVRGEPTTLLATFDVASTTAYRQDLDVAGHYSRDDVFTLTVNRSRRTTVTWTEDL